jgi:hypothetical protein
MKLRSIPIFAALVCSISAWATKPKVEQKISDFGLSPNYSAETGKPMTTEQHLATATPGLARVIQDVTFNQYIGRALNLVDDQRNITVVVFDNTGLAAAARDALVGYSQIDLAEVDGKVWFRQRGSAEFVPADKFAFQLRSQKNEDAKSEARLKRMKSGKYGWHQYERYSDWMQGAGYFDKGAEADQKPPPPNRSTPNRSTPDRSSEGLEAHKYSTMQAEHAPDGTD